MSPRTIRGEVLAEADRLVHGDRQAEYGPPALNFQRIAGIWAALFPERAWTGADVALAMAGVKLARGAQGAKRDTAVDLAGYAALWAELGEDALTPPSTLLAEQHAHCVRCTTPGCDCGTSTVPARADAS